MINRWPLAGAGTAFNLFSCLREDIGRASQCWIREDINGCDIFIKMAKETMEKLEEAIDSEKGSR